MTANPVNDLTRQFIELWQQQLGALSKDPAINAKMMDNFRLMQQSTLTWMQHYAAHAPQSGAAVPGNREPATHDLERRLSECEARIASLEQQLKKQRKGSA